MTQLSGAEPVSSPPCGAGHGPDAALFGRLVEDGFTGPLYERVADRLAGYGFQVLRAWIRRGDVLALCASRGIRGLPPTRWDIWSDDAVDDLATVLCELTPSPVSTPATPWRTSPASSAARRAM